MFDNIIGNVNNKKILKDIINNNNISHSYIFSGIPGIGKFLFAKEFAKAILCINQNNKPCNICKTCKSFENNNNPDLIIIDEKDNSIKNEQIKRLVNNILEKPTQCNKKVYIINNSENMTKEAQNSLLKTLEEPPKHIIIIIITGNENLLLNTIKSRCLKISFKKLSKEEILEYFNIKHETIDSNIINFFNGSIENALILKDKIEKYNKIDINLYDINNLNELKILSLKEKIFNNKEEVYSILDYMNNIFHNKLIENFKNITQYEKCIKAIEKAKFRLKNNSNYDMTIDNCLLEIERSLKLNG